VYLNAHFWARHFKEEYIPTIEALEQALEKKLLPSFSNLDAEAEEVSNKSFEELGNRPGNGDVDMAELAEFAEDKGVSYYITMKGIEQGIVNIMAAGLYHLFEQQLLLFYRQELLTPKEENNSNLLELNKIKKLLKEEVCIDIEAFPQWKLINESRLVANAVKHADGSSVNKLKEINPKLFQSQNNIIQENWPKLPIGSVYLPIAGEDLYVLLDDFKRYAEAIKQFWNDFGNELIKQT
jgi:hypothetical protein